MSPATVKRMADLVVHPRQTLCYESFDHLPGPAVALDGCVSGPTRFSTDHANFNHHEGTDRFTTRATCEQIALALRMHLPLLDCPTLAVHVNDPDPDVCFSVWLLDHPDAVDDPAIERLCTLEGAIDASGGTCLPGHRDDIDMLAWVIEPWATWRTTPPGTDDGLEAARMEDVIRAVGQRLDAVRAGMAERLDLSRSYDLVSTVGPVWVIHEHHPLARARAVADGATVFVAPLATADGPAHISVGKASPFVPLDLTACWSLLDAAEPVPPRSDDRWGGSDLVGGSPRHAGTHLSPEAVATVLANQLA